MTQLRRVTHGVTARVDLGQRRGREDPQLEQSRPDSEAATGPEKSACARRQACPRAHVADSVLTNSQWNFITHADTLSAASPECAWFVAAVCDTACQTPPRPCAHKNSIGHNSRNRAASKPYWLQRVGAGVSGRWRLFGSIRRPTCPADATATRTPQHQNTVNVASVDAG
jgi:hypothetical protein